MMAGGCTCGAGCLLPLAVPAGGIPYPPGVSQSTLANLGLMGRAGTASRANRLLLLFGIVAVALSVPMLHLLSFNRTAAHPTAAGKHLSSPAQDTSTDTTPRLSMMITPNTSRLLSTTTQPSMTAPVPVAMGITSWPSPALPRSSCWPSDGCCGVPLSGEGCSSLVPCRDFCDD